MRLIMPVEPKPPLGALIRAESIGIRLTATSHEASIATVIVIATLDRYSDMTLRSPNRLGMNTMMLVRVPADTANTTEERRVGNEWVRTGRSRWSPYH